MSFKFVLVLLEVFSFEKICKTVAQKFAKRCKSSCYILELLVDSFLTLNLDVIHNPVKLKLFGWLIMMDP